MSAGGTVAVSCDGRKFVGHSESCKACRTVARIVLRSRGISAYSGHLRCRLKNLNVPSPLMVWGPLKNSISVRPGSFRSMS